MNIVLAVAERSIEKYVSSFPDINVLKTLNNSRTLYNDVVETNPHFLLVSNSLAGKERVDEILQRLRKEQPQTRIAYLYGADDIIRPAFTNMLIEIGVYDFHVGEVDEDIIKELLFKPKTKDNVQIEILSEPEQKAIDEQLSKMQNQRTELREKLEKKYKKNKQGAEVPEAQTTDEKSFNISTELDKSHSLLSAIKGIHPRRKNTTDKKSDATLITVQSDTTNSVSEHSETVFSASVSKLDTKPQMTDEEILNKIDEEVARQVGNQLVVKIQYIEKVEEKEVIKVEIQPKFVKKQTISVISLYNPTIRDLFASNFSHVLAKSTNQNILLIDFDSPFPSIDYAFNVNTMELRTDATTTINGVIESGVAGCLNALRKNQLNANSLPLFAHKLKGYKNLFLMPGLFNIDIYDTVSVEDIYAIIDCAEQAYDTVILTLNNNIDNTFTFSALKKSNTILLATQPIYVNARKDIDCLTELTKKQGINKEFVSIVEWGTLLDRDTVNSMYKGYKVIGIIPDNEGYLKALNDQSIYLKGLCRKKDFAAYQKILVKLGFTQRESLLTHLSHFGRQVQLKTEQE